MKRNKRIVFVILHNIYPYDVLVSLGQTDEQFRQTIINYQGKSVLKKIEEENKESLKIDGQGKAYTGEECIPFIRLKNYPFSLRDHGTLAHEIFHIAYFILNKSGMPLTEDSEEAYAYLIDYLTKIIYSKIKL